MRRGGEGEELENDCGSIIIIYIFYIIRVYTTRSRNGRACARTLFYSFCFNLYTEED